MADDLLRTLERQMRAQMPEAPNPSQTLGRRYATKRALEISTPSQKPRIAPYRPSISKTNLGPPSISLDTALLRPRGPQEFPDSRNGCDNGMPHEQNEIVKPLKSEYMHEGADELQSLTGSLEIDQIAERAPPNHQYSNTALLGLFRYVDSGGASNPRKLEHAELSILSKINLHQAASAHQDSSDGTDDIEKEYGDLVRTTKEITRSSLSFFQVDMPARMDRYSHIPEPVSPLPRILTYGEPARPEQCMSPTCPVDEIHGVGLYVHQSRWGTRPHEVFGISNPPDYIWAAQARIALNYASTEDKEMVRQFVAHHDRPYPGA